MVTGDDLRDGRVQIPMVEPYQKVEITLTGSAELTSDAPRTFSHKVRFRLSKNLFCSSLIELVRIKYSVELKYILPGVIPTNGY